MYLTKELIHIQEKDFKRYQIFKKEKKLIDFWSKYSFYDFIIQEKERSQKGAFYTPEWIVRLMVKNSFSILKKKGFHLENIKILEPSCGSGNFLQILIEELQKETQKSYDSIVNNNIYCLDIDSKAIALSKERIKTLFDVELKNIFCEDALFFHQGQFDLIIGNPPYGNILSSNIKEKIHDKYHNIALNFLDHFFNLLNPNALLYFIVPHSFSRAGQGSLLWRKKIIENQSLHEIIDVGNPFFDITLEQIIIGLTKEKNEEVITNSIRYNQIGNVVEYKEIFNNPEKIISIYYDTNYVNIKNKNLKYPFSGKRGKDFKKTDLNNFKESGNYWVILGKNITKDGVKNIKNYDKYSKNNQFLMKDQYVAITQFGSHLKASLIPKNTIPSGGIVIIQHEGLTQEEAIQYLNNPKINDYLKKYILNGAKLTVHLDGKYLQQIPYNIFQ